MSLIGTVANYGGKQPDNSQNIKQFVVGIGNNNASWVIKRLSSGLTVQTPVSSNVPVYINNDLYVTGSIYNTSDLALKDNVIALSKETTNNLLNLQPVTYSFKSDIQKKIHHGFIAQDVEKIFPNLVSNNVLGYKTVNYIELMPIIISKMKSMQNEIDELKLLIQELRDDIR